MKSRRKLYCDLKPGEYAQFAGQSRTGVQDNHNFKAIKSDLPGWTQVRGVWTSPVEIRQSSEGGQYLVEVVGDARDAKAVQKCVDLLKKWRQEFRALTKKQMFNACNKTVRKTTCTQKRKCAKCWNRTPYYTSESNRQPRRTTRRTEPTQTGEGKPKTTPQTYTQWCSNMQNKIRAVEGQIWRAENDERQGKRRFGEAKRQRDHKETSRQEKRLEKLDRTIKRLREDRKTLLTQLQKSKAPTPVKRAPKRTPEQRTQSLDAVKRNLARAVTRRRPSRGTGCHVCKGTGKRMYGSQEQTCLRCHGIENWTYVRENAKPDVSNASDTQSEASVATTWTASGHEAPSESVSISSTLADPWTQGASALGTPGGERRAQDAHAPPATPERCTSPVESLPAVPETTTSTAATSTVAMSTTACSDVSTTESIVDMSTGSEPSERDETEEHTRQAEMEAHLKQAKHDIDVTEEPPTEHFNLAQIAHQVADELPQRAPRRKPEQPDHAQEEEAQHIEQAQATRTLPRVSETTDMTRTPLQVRRTDLKDLQWEQARLAGSVGQAARPAPIGPRKAPHRPERREGASRLAMDSRAAPQRQMTSNDAAEDQHAQERLRHAYQSGVRATEDQYRSELTRMRMDQEQQMNAMRRQFEQQFDQLRRNQLQQYGTARNGLAARLDTPGVPTMVQPTQPGPSQAGGQVAYTQQYAYGNANAGQWNPTYQTGPQTRQRHRMTPQAQQMGYDANQQGQTSLFTQQPQEYRPSWNQFAGTTWSPTTR